MTRTQKKKHDASISALNARILQGGKLCPESLARSYGLKKSDVEIYLRRAGHGSQEI